MNYGKNLRYLFRTTLKHQNQISGSSVLCFCILIEDSLKSGQTNVKLVTNTFIIDYVLLISRNTLIAISVSKEKKT